MANERITNEKKWQEFINKGVQHARRNPHELFELIYNSAKLSLIFKQAIIKTKEGYYIPSETSYANIVGTKRARVALPLEGASFLINAYGGTINYNVIERIFERKQTGKPYYKLFVEAVVKFKDSQSGEILEFNKHGSFGTDEKSTMDTQSLDQMGQKTALVNLVKGVFSLDIIYTSDLDDIEKSNKNAKKQQTITRTATKETTNSATENKTPTKRSIILNKIKEDLYGKDKTFEKSGDILQSLNDQFANDDGNPPRGKIGDFTSVELTEWYEGRMKIKRINAETKN